MLLSIPVKNKKFAAEYIPQILRGYVEANFNIQKAKQLEKYLKELQITQTIRSLLMFAVDNLRVTKSLNGYVLTIDKNKYPPGSKYNIEVITTLINYGTADVRGYSILDDAFNYVKANLEKLKLVYIKRYEIKKKEE